MFHKYVVRLVDYLKARAIKKGRVYEINGRHPDDTDVYLMRYIVARNRWFRIFIHEFHRSDEDVFHDHPWRFLTYITKGRYIEHTLEQRDGVFKKAKRMLFERNWVYRKPNHIHRVELHEYCTSPPQTFNIMGPKFKDWGFWVQDGETYKRITWTEYLQLPADYKYREKRDNSE